VEQNTPNPEVNSKYPIFEASLVEYCYEIKY